MCVCIKTSLPRKAMNILWAGSYLDHNEFGFGHIQVLG